MVLAKQPQRLADRVPANRKPLAELFFGRKLRADRIDPFDDLILQGAHDLEIQRLVGLAVINCRAAGLRRHCEAFNRRESGREQAREQ